MGLSGLEPPTSRLSGVRSNRLSYKPIFPGFSVLPQAFGGDKRDRTADPLLAKQVLSQLSYTPVYLGQDPENKTTIQKRFRASALLSVMLTLDVKSAYFI